jgi:hypothetical protein
MLTLVSLVILQLQGVEDISFGRKEDQPAQLIDPADVESGLKPCRSKKRIRSKITGRCEIGTPDDESHRHVRISDLVGCSAEKASHDPQDAWRFGNLFDMNGLAKDIMPVISGGNFGGYNRFREMLLEGLSCETLQKLKHCNVVTSDFDKCSEQGTCGKPVWLMVNAEDDTARSTWEQINTSKHYANQRFVLIGNWWNEAEMEHKEEMMSTIWVPFASINFAERLTSTPLDLLNRSHTTFEKRPGVAMYAHSGCGPGREEFWDSLNERLIREDMPRGIAIGRCNGNKKLGIHKPDGKHYAYDANSVTNEAYKVRVRACGKIKSGISADGIRAPRKLA